jgi:hypothetical protein
MNETPRETRTAALGLRVTPSIMARLKEAADHDHRPVASYVEKLIVDHLLDRCLPRRAQRR